MYLNFSARLNADKVKTLLADPIHHALKGSYLENTH